MAKLTKRFKEIQKLLEEQQGPVKLEEAIEILKKCPSVKFDQTLELSLKLGVDPKKADQQVRGSVSLPHGTGKAMKILVFAKGEKVKEALEAKAEFAGSDELIEKIKKGWTDFDAVIATPDMMREVGKLGKILGPRGLMPSPKAGTVTQDVTKTVQELKAGKVEFKVDKSGLINMIAGKLSFQKEQLVENIKTILKAIQKAKPAAAKGIYMKSLALSSTMGPGLNVEISGLV